ncbi:MAG: sigma-70 family RNA polymerase sigma factor [Anaerolineae bacterium]|jgi:RNA polymerase sigma-70 factor (ECF subfamily)|nr:sigma-70 family RNA polymerase sigma factor [Anaerolineae bacterium]
MMDELALIASAQKGDLRAFNQLVLLYQSMAYNVAYRILTDPDAAADATQDAFFSAYKAMKKFRGGSFKAWLLRIVTNACYDQLRVKKRRPTSSLDGLPVESEHSQFLRDESESPDEFLERQELGHFLQHGISALPIEQRAVLVLSDVQGLSYQEVAEIMDLSLGTVKSRLSRGRARLRDFLLERGELLPARYRLKDDEETEHTEPAGGRE